MMVGSIAGVDCVYFNWLTWYEKDVLESGRNLVCAV